MARSRVLAAKDDVHMPMSQFLLRIGLHMYMNITAPTLALYLWRSVEAWKVLRMILATNTVMALYQL